MPRLITIVFALTLLGSCADKVYADKTIRVGTVTVLSTKASGAAWDAGDGAPDIKVSIREKKFFSGLKNTSVKKNTYSTTFNEDTISIAVGKSIEIKVWDKDFASDDLIGSGTFVIDAADFNRGSVELAPKQAWV